MSKRAVRKAPLTFSGLLGRWATMGDIARDLAIPYETVVAWRRRDSIPNGYWSALEASAQKHGIKGVTYEQFRQIADSRNLRFRPAQSKPLRNNRVGA
jgi:hypothetical protein